MDMQVKANLYLDKLSLVLILLGHWRIPSSQYYSILLLWVPSKFIIKWPFVKYLFILDITPNPRDLFHSASKWLNKTKWPLPLPATHCGGKVL